VSRGAAAALWLLWAAGSIALGEVACHRRPAQPTTPAAVVVTTTCMEPMPVLESPDFPSVVDDDGTVHVPVEEMAKLYVYLHTLRVYLEQQLARCGER